jgi:exonuclease III
LQLDIKADKPLNLFINHLKSQGYTGKGDPGGNIRREGQAKRVVEIIDNLDLKGEYVIVAGDLNCDSSSPSLAPLLTNPDLYNLNLRLPPDERGTYLKTKQQLDYLIVTEQLKEKCMDISINRTGIFTVPGVNGMNSKTEAASDHAAVVADFEF